MVVQEHSKVTGLVLVINIYTIPWIP